MTVTTYPASPPPHFATDAGTRASLTTTRQDTGWSANEPLPALGANALWGESLDWLGYLSSLSPSNGVWRVEQVQIYDTAGGTQVGRLFRAGNNLSLEGSVAGATYTLTADGGVFLTSDNGNITMEATNGAFGMVSNGNLGLTIGNNISGTVTGIVNLTVTGGSFRVGTAVYAGGGYAYSSDQSWQEPIQCLTMIDRVTSTITRSFTSTEPGPKWTASVAGSAVWQETLLCFPNTTGLATYQILGIDGFAYRSNTGSNIVIEVIGRTVANPSVETVITSWTFPSGTGWQQFTTSVTTAVNSAQIYVVRVTATYGGAHDVGWGHILVSADKSHIE